jgi:hypothetical protein
MTSPIYTNGLPIGTEGKATQIRHLALIGIAAGDSVMNVKGLDGAMCSLFEVIARLAEEVEADLQSRPQGLSVVSGGSMAG